MVHWLFVPDEPLGKHKINSIALQTQIYLHDDTIDVIDTWYNC